MRPPDCPYGPDCDPSVEPCCNGCASGLGPCHGPGYRLICCNHDSHHDHNQEEETPDATKEKTT